MRDFEVGQEVQLKADPAWTFIVNFPINHETHLPDARSTVNCLQLKDGVATNVEINTMLLEPVPSDKKSKDLERFDPSSLGLSY